MSNDADEEWTSYRRLVLSGLLDTASKIDRLDSRIKEFQVELAILRVKAGVWGMLGGLIPVAVMLAVQLLGGALR